MKSTKDKHKLINNFDPLNTVSLVLPIISIIWNGFDNVARIGTHVLYIKVPFVKYY